MPVHVSTKDCFVKDGTVLGRASVAAMKMLIKMRTFMTAIVEWELYIEERGDE
jgi:hypothetical protein